MIEWAVTSSVSILVVLTLRQCLMGKISLRLQYGLWVLVLLRLLLPVSFGATAVSVLNIVEQTQLPDPVVGYVGGVTPELSVVEPDPSLSLGGQQEQHGQELDRWQTEVDTAREKASTPVSLGTVLLGIWAVGAVSIGLWLLWVNVRFAGELRRSRRPLEAEDCPLPVYVTEAAQTPCLFGAIHPCIYVTEQVAADETVLRHSLAHELTHYRHKDHIWAILRGICLALHWYDPLVWVAAALSRQDGELCCDEATVKRLGEGERAAYGRTLLAVTCPKRGDPLLAATSMTGSGNSIKERIRLLVKRPKTAAYTLAAVVLIAAAAVGCTFTGASPTDDIKPWDWAQSVTADRLAEENTGLDAELCAQVLNGLDEERFTQKKLFTDGIDLLIVNYDATQYPFLLTEEDGVIYLEFEGAFWRIDSPELYVFVQEQLDQPAMDITSADLDQDGVKETIQAVQIDPEVWHMVVTKEDGTEIFREELGLPHVGWNSLYLYRDSQNRDCLLRYAPAIATGMASFSYTLFTLEGGEENVVAEGELDFELSQVPDRIEELVAFANEVNAILRHSALLLSTQDGELVVGPEPMGAHLERLNRSLGFGEDADTVFTYDGQDYDLSERNESINAITSFMLVGQYLVFEGHTGPKNSIYSIFDTVSKSFGPDLVGANLIFRGDDITTGIYSFWSDVYAYDGTLLASYGLEENEFIYELRYSEDLSQIIVCIVDEAGDMRTERIDLAA